MTPYWFVRSEVIHVPYAPDEVEFMLSSCTEPAKNFDPTPRWKREEISNMYRFCGVVGNGKFSISKRVSYPQNFLPRIDGVIRDVDPGSCVEITYRLFPSTVVLFFLGFFLSLGIGIYFSFFTEKWGYGLGGFIGFGLNYLICIGNFNIHQKDAKKELEKVFDL